VETELSGGKMDANSSRFHISLPQRPSLEEVLELSASSKTFVLEVFLVRKHAFGDCNRGMAFSNLLSVDSALTVQVNDTSDQTGCVSKIEA
jgi:hypothetical protein